ncbi:hypothetical protein AAC387_Pa05g1157 [Persea americana]
MIRRKRRNCGRRNPVISSEPIKSDRPGTAQLHHSSPAMGTSPAPYGNGLEVAKEADSSDKLEEDGGREKLQRHRSDVAGQVWIPEIWGQEELMKDWVDCAAFDRSFVSSGIMSARDALVEECRRMNSGGLRIENRC